MELQTPINAISTSFVKIFNIFTYRYCQAAGLKQNVLHIKKPFIRISVKYNNLFQLKSGRGNCIDKTIINSIYFFITIIAASCLQWSPLIITWRSLAQHERITKLVLSFIDYLIWKAAAKERYK